MYGYCYKYTRATYDRFCGPGSHISIVCVIAVINKKDFFLLLASIIFNNIFNDIYTHISDSKDF